MVLFKKFAFANTNIQFEIKNYSKYIFTFILEEEFFLDSLYKTYINKQYELKNT